MKVRSFRDLIVWQKSINLAEVIYTLTSTLPEDEKFGLVSQMRRAVVSIPSNIAEGHKMRSGKFYSNFLRLALGSSAELETQLIITGRVHPQSKDIDKLLNLNEEIQRMLFVMIRKLEKK